jgi:adenosyl cobinamide kinase/adenosyl cobinamide phosphate guanylyltransferase
MFSIDDGQPIAIVEGGKSNGEIIFVNLEDKKANSVIKRDPVTLIEVFDGKFQQLPSEEVRILYIAGPSGSGKSTYAANYIEKYRKLHPKSKFFIFSKLREDDVLDRLKPHRITITEELIENPIELEEVEVNSILLFDDVDTISNKKLMDTINKFKSQVLEMGRHTNIKCIITSHLINGNNRGDTRTVLNEMQALTIFPKSGSAYQIKYVLKQYFGFSNVQMKAILNTDSRWITIFKNYPQIILSENKAVFAQKL